MDWRRTSWILLLGVCLGTAAVSTHSLQAQPDPRTDRSLVASPAALGMGDAAVALAGDDQVFFYNPAHLPHVDSWFAVFGLQGATTRSFDDHVRFLNQQAGPVVNAGFDVSDQVLDEMRRSAEALHRRPGWGRGDILLPAFVYSPGALAIGGGLFAETAASYHLRPRSVGLSSAWMLSRTDLLALLSVGLDLRVLGLPGLSVGVTGTRTRRFLAFKNKPLDQFARTEPAVLLEGGTFQFDAGVTYALESRTLPGTFRLGGAVYDMLPGGYGYAPGETGRLPFLDDIVDRPAADSIAPAAAEVRRARRLFTLRPSYRLGGAYQLPALLFLEDVGVAVDYKGVRGGNRDLHERFHLGARATVTGTLELRIGVGAGYPSGGLGVELGALNFDYSLHGGEATRQAPPLSAYVHTARLRVRFE